MKTYVLNVSRRAEHDTDVIFEWLAARSPEGADRWYQTLRESLTAISKNPIHYSLAPEADLLGLEIRQSPFKTRRGRLYRALFIVEQDTVHVVAVRGSGQAFATWDDLDLPL